MKNVEKKVLYNAAGMKKFSYWKFVNFCDKIILMPTNDM